MKKKDNQELLNEELKRFNQINEYDFYIGEDDEIDAYDKRSDSDLILGEEGDEDELPDDLPADDLGSEDVPADDEFGGEDVPADGMEPTDDLGGEEMPEEPVEDEVELDVTELVASSEEAKQSAEMANQKIDDLMGMLDNLDNKMSSMDGITAKIDNLENELEKRAPTPDEKLEMRSLDSYPYNLKLTDFWSEKEGQYDVMDVNDEKATPDEYTLTHDDINSDYNETSIKNTFNDDNEYEEEEI